MRGFSVEKGDALFRGRIGRRGRRFWKWDSKLRFRGFCENLGLVVGRILGVFLYVMDREVCKFRWGSVF